MNRGAVLLIRPDGNDRDAAELARAGIATLTEPLLEIVPVTDAAAAAELAIEVDSLGAGDWLLLTSPRTWGCWSTLAASELSQQLVNAVGRGVRVACVGPATAASLPALPAEAVLISAGLSAEDLLAELLALPQAGAPTALLPASAQARSVLPDGLRAAGWKVQTAAVYQTQLRRPEPASPIWQGEFAAVIVRSPSAADALHALGVLRVETTVFAVGPISAARCHRHGWRVIEVSDTRAAEVTSVIADWFKAKQEGSR